MPLRAREPFRASLNVNNKQLFINVVVIILTPRTFIIMIHNKLILFVSIEDVTQYEVHQ